jgi:hypothetical protein
MYYHHITVQYWSGRIARTVSYRCCVTIICSCSADAEVIDKFFLSIFFVSHTITLLLDTIKDI